jgi:hypothetical protein
MRSRFLLKAITISKGLAATQAIKRLLCHFSSHKNKLASGKRKNRKREMEVLRLDFFLV